MKKLFISLSLMLLLVTSCGKVPKLSSGEDAVVTLKDTQISVDSLYQEMKDTYALSVLLDMVDRSILDELYPSDEDEQEYIDGQLSQLQLYYEYYYKEQYSTFEYFVTSQYGVSDMETVEDMFALSYKRSKAMEDYSKELVTDKEIKKYYEDTTIGDIKVKHILIKVDYEDDATEDEKKKVDEDALKEAKEVISKLKNGEKFEDLAKKYSDDDSKEDGGELNYFNRGEMESEFEKAAIKLKEGKYTTTPVKTKYGYHIILKVDQKEKPKLEEVKDTIIETLAEEKQQEDENITVKALIKLREDNEIKIEDDKLNKQYKNFVSQYE